MECEPHVDSTDSVSITGAEDSDECAFIRWISPRFGPCTVFGDSRVSLGRDRSCAAVLQGARVSRHHAEIVSRGPIHVIRDCDSKNGVFVDGHRVVELPLSVGQTVRIGDWLGVVMVGDRAQRARLTIDRLAEGLYAGPTFARALTGVCAVSAATIPIILEGATGTGKERVARAIHTWSGRRGAFVAINCAAIPESLAEAELFGFRRGAFTGADAAAKGHVRSASGGTLLLDEVSDLSLGIQVKLLRVLQEGQVLPLGESSPIDVDVRVVVASQRPLRTLVREGRFRADLWARLNGVTIRLPTLEERKEEIPFLFLHMLEEAGMRDVAVSPECLEHLCVHDWPLNLRELSALARRIAVIHRDERLLTTRHLVDLRGQDEGAVVAASGDRRRRTRSSRAYSTQSIEALQLALSQHGDNVTRAAAALKITRSRAYRLLEAARRRAGEDLRGE
jgi:transcriptional regulator with PAS, ATPase and Fis domain